jgi:hypothetical protein
MVQAIRQEVTVQKDSMIEIHSPALKPGSHVEVILLIEEVSIKKQSLSSLIGTGKGSYASPSEADAFIRGERDKWE